jgi:hypothetical protein
LQDTIGFFELALPVRRQMRSGRRAEHNANGTTDDGDYNVWRTHFGQTTGSGSSSSGAVPEPAAILLLLFAAAREFRRRRPRRRVSKLDDA